MSKNLILKRVFLPTGIFFLFICHHRIYGWAGPKCIMHPAEIQLLHHGCRSDCPVFSKSSECTICWYFFCSCFIVQWRDDNIYGEEGQRQAKNEDALFPFYGKLDFVCFGSGRNVCMYVKWEDATVTTKIHLPRSHKPHACIKRWNVNNVTLFRGSEQYLNENYCKL